MQNQAEQKEKSYIITLLLCLFFGCFGLHRFYTGYNKIGIMQLLLTISIIGVLASGMWALIDLILIIFNKYKTYNKETLVNDFLIASNTSNILISYSYTDDAADKLLKMATKYKKDNIDMAIDYLKKAYVEIAKTETEYSINTFLRLPLFLQAAGRTQEALDEFNKLLQNGYPNQNRIPELIPMHESQIYDKLRLFWQREKQPIKAISYGVYSILLDALGLYRQKRKQELSSIVNNEFIAERIMPLLQKAKKIYVVDKISDLIISEINKLPSIAEYQIISAAIDKIMAGQAPP